jgi:hypothetical protein
MSVYLNVEEAMIKKSALIVSAAIMAGVSLSRPAFAQDTAYGHITTLQTGSRGGAPSAVSRGQAPKIVADDTVAVTLDVPFVNSTSTPATQITPAGPPCKITTGGYALDPADPGVKVAESVLLSAYLAGKRVSLDLYGCIFDKPKIVSVTMNASEN